MSGETNAFLDVKLVFDGQTHFVRPKFEIVAAIEAVTNQPCILLAQKCYGGRKTDPVRWGDTDPVSLTEIGAILFTILRFTMGKDAPDQAKVGEIIMRDGYGDLTEPVGDFLARAVRGNTDHEKRARAQAEAEAKGVEEEKKAAPSAQTQEGETAQKPSDPPQAAS